MIGQTKVHLTLADTGIVLASIPVLGPSINDPSPFRLRSDIYNMTADASDETERKASQASYCNQPQWVIIEPDYWEWSRVHHIATSLNGLQLNQTIGSVAECKWTEQNFLSVSKNVCLDIVVHAHPSPLLK